MLVTLPARKMGTCSQCGEWSLPPVAVEPTGAAAADAVCPQCGYRQPFVYLPLFVVTGANGTGKSAVAAPLRRRLPECVVFEADVIPLPWTLDEWPAHKEEYRETCLSVALEIVQSGRPVVLVGTVLPREFEDSDLRPLFSQSHYLALVCDGATIEQRLRRRPASHTPFAADFAAYLSTQIWVDDELRTLARGDPSITLVDTSSASVDDAADKIASWVRERLPAGACAH